MTAVEERRDVADDDGRESDDVVIAAMELDTDGSADPVAPTAPADIRILSGAPTDEDIAALVAVLAAAAASRGSSVPTGPRDDWGRPARMHRGAVPFSPYSFTVGSPT